MPRIFSAVCLLVFIGGVRAATPDEQFEKVIRPLLVEKCLGCHGEKKPKGDLRLDSLAGMLKGGESGPAIVPGKPEQSLLVIAVRHNEQLKMPKDKLPAADIAALAAWVKAGAVWPDAKPVVPEPAKAVAVRTFTDEEKAFWAFQPVKKVVPADTGKNPIDHFIDEKRKATGVTAAPAADKRTLIRRLTFDLTGLPPTAAEVEAFENDTSPEAWDKLVDRLLASSAYGEKWGRRWLDVARYADSNGMDENLAHGNAWRYRDYVIRSFNADKPYNQFVKEQIAGDLLPGGTPEERADRVTATGFLVIGPKMLAEDDPMKMRMDIIDEQVDTLGQAFLGLTLGCARCHDHKFDPLTQADYYAVAGMFYSTKSMRSYGVVAQWHERPVGSAESVAKLAEFEKKRAAASDMVKKPEKQLRDAVKTRLDAERKRASEYAEAALQLAGKPKEPTTVELAKEKKLLLPLLRAWVKTAEKWKDELPAADELLKIATDPQGPFKGSPELDAAVDATLAAEVKKAKDELAAVEKAKPVIDEAMAVEEDAKAQNLRIHLRGSHLTLGAETPRRFPVIVAGEKQEAITKGSGRLELAEWVASPTNPLTARVMANRVWLGHFGTGLVRTPDNFGRLGERPTHPELLDYLASEFVASGWSVKHLHRLIVKSVAYRMSTEFDADKFKADPENRAYWRFNRRRLDVEELRDGMLAVAGNLDRKAGGTLLPTKSRDYVNSTGGRGSIDFTAPRRSVYLPVIRSGLFDVFQVNDFPDPSTTSGLRPQTTVPAQALFHLNSGVADQSSAAFAKSLLEVKGDDATRINEAYRRVYTRPPTTIETERVLRFLAASDVSTDAKKLKAWQSLCRVLLSSAEFAFVE